MIDGVFPTTDQYGQQFGGERGRKANSHICGGWRAGFESWVGDWKERSLSHCFVRRNYQSTFLCDQCKAVQPHKKTPAELLHLIYSDFSLTAPWVGTIRNHAMYLNETPVSQRTPWLALPGFDITRVRWDSAHTILLGTGKDVAAAVLCDWVSCQQITIISLPYTWNNKEP